MQRKFELFRKLIRESPSLTTLPEIVVNYDEIHPLFTNQADLAPYSKQIRAHNKKWEMYGLYYIPNVISPNEELELMVHTMKYMQTHGTRVEEQHLIQREHYGLDPNLSVIQKLRKRVASKCRVALNEVQSIPNFNYYPFSTTSLIPHHDNLFLANEIAVVTCGFNDAARKLHFQHWVHNHSFDLYVEPRSMYIMSGKARYEYTHGASAPLAEGSAHGSSTLAEGSAAMLDTSIYAKPNDPELDEVFRNIKGQRLSYVFGVNTNRLDMQTSVAQVWGEAEQRRIVDQQYGGPFDLFHYLNLVNYLTQKEDYHPILQKYIPIVKKNYEKKSMCYNVTEYIRTKLHL